MYTFNSFTHLLVWTRRSTVDASMQASLEQVSWLASSLSPFHVIFTSPFTKRWDLYQGFASGNQSNVVSHVIFIVIMIESTSWGGLSGPRLIRIQCAVWTGWIQINLDSVCSANKPLYTHVVIFFYHVGTCTTLVCTQHNVCVCNCTVLGIHRCCIHE